jgi:hypothetical protein
VKNGLSRPFTTTARGLLLLCQGRIGGHGEPNSCKNDQQFLHGTPPSDLPAQEMFLVHSGGNNPRRPANIDRFRGVNLSQANLAPSSEICG